MNSKRTSISKKNPDSEMDDSKFLPEGVIFHILSWLPAKSVGQCRCVCKLWRDLLTQPQFIKTHLNHSKLFPHRQDYSFILVRDNDSSLYSINLNSAHHLFDENTILPKKLSKVSKPAIMIHGSCDGLLLVEATDPMHYILINPATQQMKEVPWSPFVLNLEDSRCFAGFGYDSVSDDYKIVSISYCLSYHDINGSKETLVSVFSVKNGTWKSAGSFPFAPLAPLFGDWYPSVFVNGYIHRIAYRTTDYKQVLVAFDLAQEKFCEVPIPRTFIAEEDSWAAGLGGCLCLYSRKSFETEIWMMEEYGVQKSWTMFIHPVEGTPLCFLSQAQLVLLETEPSLKLVIYNMADGTSKGIASLEEQPDFMYFETISESLVSPHSINFH